MYTRNRPKTDTVRPVGYYWEAAGKWESTAGSHVASDTEVVGTVQENQSVDATSTDHLDFGMLVGLLL
jgi:hypothetical protein